MNRIAKFKEFSKNEELFHGYAGSGSGEQGSKIADKIFRKVGKFFGNSADILNDYLVSKVDDGEIDQATSNQLFDMLEYSTRGKKKDEIMAMVDAKIAEME